MPTDTNADATAEINATSTPDVEETHQEDSTTTDAPESQDDGTHQQVEELKKKHSAARKGLDEKAKLLKEKEAEIARLKVLAGEDSKEETPEEDESQPKYVTQEELDSKAWEIAHKSDLELYSDDEFKSDVESGIPKEKALKYAKLRYETMDDSARRERQEAVASTGSVNRDGQAPIDSKVLPEHKEKFGIKDETIQKYSSYVEGRE